MLLFADSAFSAYCGGLYLAALTCMKAMAEKTGDTEAAAKYSEVLERGKVSERCVTYPEAIVWIRSRTLSSCGMESTLATIQGYSLSMQ